MIKTLSIALATAAFAATAATAVTTISVEAPGAFNTTLTVNGGGVETFNTVALGVNTPFVTNFGGSGVTATLNTISVANADIYGGAGSPATRYAQIIDTTTLNFAGAPVNYFGLYVSGADAGNQIAIFNGATLLFSGDFASIGAGLSSAYKGNPSSSFPGANPTEPYAFYNFTTDTPFTRIVFTNVGAGTQGLFEADNFTVGTAVVPEPASWALLIVGFAMVGVSARRRSRYAAA